MSGPDQAEVRNEILSALSTEDFRCLSPHLQLIDRPFKKTLIVAYVNELRPTLLTNVGPPGFNGCS
jgi:hypothetical protein